MDYSNQTLFGEKYISTISYDEQEIIRDILHLHANDRPIECDPTYSIGNFYKKGLDQPKYKYDKFPQVPGVVEATANNLPLDPESISVMMFDPPFVMSGKLKDSDKNGKRITDKRFSYFTSWPELKQMYSSSLKEFSRILRLDGILIFKCQDVIVSAKQHFTHCWTMYEAVKFGFYPLDLFVLLAKNRLNDGRKQQHARKFHSYYWVFKKRSCKVNYEGISP